MTKDQYKNLVKAHTEVLQTSYNALDDFVKMVTNDLSKIDLTKEERDSYNLAFDYLFEAKKSLEIAKAKMEIVKEITNE